MTSPERPTPRPRAKATPAVDEAAGATPITPTARVTAAPVAGHPGAFTQLNVRIGLDVQSDLEYLMTREGLNKVNAVSFAIRKAAGRERSS